VAERLRDSLGAVAGGVRPSPDAYERALGQWRRRERRRRLAGVLLAAVLVAGADGVGLWALNHSASAGPSTPAGPVVFDGPAPAVAP
jgi:ferric-dicitrate binding protein FerR (iron transport regulator)